MKTGTVSVGMWSEDQIQVKDNVWEMFQTDECHMNVNCYVLINQLLIFLGGGSVGDRTEDLVSAALSYPHLPPASNLEF